MRWSISETTSRWWAPLLVIPLLSGLGKNKDKAEPPNPEAVAEVDAPKLKGDLFPSELPLDPGQVPSGLYATSAQVCAACHPTAVARWEDGPHARGPSSALLEAATGMPACLGCHRPLVAQSDQLYTWDGGRIDRPVATDNPRFEATLQIEGVTCAACHLRDGLVVTGSEQAAARQAPHPMAWSNDLAKSDGCAACHQLTWPGAQEPLYDTYGEWKRSGFAEIGVSCQDCHLRAAADGGPLDHAMVADPAQALTIELGIPSTRLVRGAGPVPATITLTNTGAGHAFPTGSPFRGVELQVLVEGPSGARAGEPLKAQLQRSLEPTAPFAVLGDTRLGFGESRKFELPLSIPPDAPPGTWTVHLTLRRTVRGETVGEPLVDRRWSLVVE